MAGEVGSSALESGAAGAAFGSNFGPWGAAIGGAVGLIGGAIGGAKKRRRAKRLKRLQRQATALQRDVQRKTIIRENMAAQAAVIQGVTASGVGLGSSGAQGIKNSVASQASFNIDLANRQNQLSDLIGSATAKMNRATWDEQVRSLLGGSGGGAIAGAAKGIGGSLQAGQQGVPLFAQKTGSNGIADTYGSGIDGVDYLRPNSSAFAKRG